MANPIIVLIATAKAKAGMRETLLEQLQTLIAPTRAEDGCMQYELNEDAQNAGTFIFIEKWASQEQLDAHSASAHLKAFVEMSTESLESLNIQKLHYIL